MCWHKRVRVVCRSRRAIYNLAKKRHASGCCGTVRLVNGVSDAGTSPLLAIRAATLDAARVITRTKDPEYGSVQAGKIADLLLLDADPTVDISNTIRIARAMRAGQWLQALAAQATRAAAGR